MSDEESKFSRRSSRFRSKNTSVTQALELLKKCRKDGKAHRQNVEEFDDDPYDYVDDDEYIKRFGDDDFVEDDDGGGYAETGEDYFDEDEYGTKKKEKRPKIKKGGIDNYFAKVVTKPAPKEEKAIAEPDDDLDAMLAQIENADGTELIAGKVQDLLEEPCFPSKNKFKRSPSPTFTSPKPMKIRKREIFIPKKAPEPVSDLDSSVNYMDFDVGEVPSSVKPSTPLKDVNVEPVAVETEKSANEEVNQFSTIQIGEIIEEESSTTVSYGIPTDFFVDQEDGTKNLRFYWFDAFEDVKNPSRVCLFGAIKTGLNSFESCCVVIENIQRRIFFIQREESEKLELYNEVQDLLMTKYGVKLFMARPVKRKLAYMDGETPELADCLEVFYDFNLPGFPAGLHNGKAYNRIGNATVTALERLLIERDIKGPCWLEISGVKEIEMNQKISHCQKEFQVVLPIEKPLLTSINVICDWQNEPLPICRMMALNVVTVGNNKTHKPEIVLISVMRSKNYIFNKQTPIKWEKVVCFVCPPTGGTIPFQFQVEATKKKLNVEKLANENALLNRFLIELKNFDPDVIVGHDLASQFQILRDRIEERNLTAQKWSVLGRLKRSSNLKQMPSNKQFRWSLTTGRLLLDSKSAAMELLHCQSYDLDELVHQVLVPVMPNANRKSVDDEQISKVFLDNSGKTDNLFSLIEWSFCDAQFATLILAHLNAMPLFLQITQIVGGVLSRTLMGGRAERNEYLLLHAFFKDDYIAPDKLPPKFGKKTEGKKENEDEQQATNTKKAQYTGGLVLEPKKGLYETFIVLLDFNSLYPSIIQEFNICFTTVKLQQREQANENDLPPMPDSSGPKGILPREIAKLVFSRREVKNEMKKCSDKKSDRYKQYDIRQLGLKLTANSMYGCLGFEGSRFCAKTLAAMITFKGRQILESTKDLVESKGYTVIYGDTDSIMVNTNSTNLEETKKIGTEIKILINKNYRCLAMDIDGVYKRLLLLKKKKYAGLVIDLNNEQKLTREMKGLDIVRRDWSVLAKEVGEKIVNVILESNQRDEMIEKICETLKEVKLAIEEQKLSLEKFEILKKLTHKPEDYKDAKSQPHVQVALRLNQTRNTNFRQNDIIKYIICDDGTDQASTQRAYAKIEIELNKNLKIDSHYYLAQQIHPVVARLCEPIEEMDACQVAMALGLDPTGYRRKLKDQADDFINDENNDPGLESEFNACDGFALECPECGKVRIIRSIINEDGKLSFSECPDCKRDLTQNAFGIEIQLVEAIQTSFKKCRDSVYKCDDDMCNYTQSFKPMMKNNFGDVCPKCEIGFMKKEYTWRKLYVQQKFWLQIVDLNAFLIKEATPQQKKMIESDIKFPRLMKYHDVWTKRVKGTILHNAYSKVDLSIIFAPMEIF